MVVSDILLYGFIRECAICGHEHSVSFLLNEEAKTFEDDKSKLGYKQVFCPRCGALEVFIYNEFPQTEQAELVNMLWDDVTPNVIDRYNALEG